MSENKEREGRREKVDEGDWQWMRKNRREGKWDKREGRVRKRIRECK